MTTPGPLSPAVYWRRRLFVLGTVLALVLFVVNLVRDDGEPAATGDSAWTVSADQSGRPSAGPTDEPRDRGEKKKRKKRNKDGGETGETTPPPEPEPEPEPAAPSGPCEDADVSVTPSVSGAVAGQPVTITLTLQTLTAAACTWTVGADTVALKVTDGGAEVWQSVECPRQLPSSDVVVRRELTATVAVTWNARYTSAGCPPRPKWATAGEYYVQAAALGGEPSDVVAFELLDGSEVVVPDGPIGPEVPGADQGERDGEDKNRGKKNKGKGKPDGAVEPDGPARR